MEKMMESIGRTIRKVLEDIIFRILKIKFTPEKWELFWQFVKFGIVGVSNTAISYAIYLGTLWAFQWLGWLPKTDYLVAQFLGFAISVLWSFVLNRKYVFEADGEDVLWPRALLKTYASYAFTGLFLNSVLSVLWVEWLGISKLIAPVFNLLISVPINFLLNKFWAFRESR